MRADLEDQLGPVEKRHWNPVARFLLALVLLGGVVLLWYYIEQQQTPEPTAPVPPPALPVPEPAIAVPAAPDIPQRPEPAPVVTLESEPPVQPALPTPQQGDEVLLGHLKLTGVDVLLNRLENKVHLLDRSAALIDGLSQGIILRKILPADAPQEAFAVETVGSSIYMSADGYERYNGYAASIASLDIDLLADSFHTLRPLYERAYQQLGLDSADFDNAVIRALDVVLGTPEIEGVIELRRKSVMYLYADPALEQLPAVQKQLLRMGPDNIRSIKQQAQQLRNALLGQ